MNQGLKILIYGPPGVDKTFFGSSTEKTLVIDVEKGLGSVPAFKKKNVELVQAKSISAILEIAKNLKNMQRHNYKVVVLDSLDHAQILLNNQPFGFERDIQIVIDQFSDLPILFIATCHERATKSP